MRRSAASDSVEEDEETMAVEGDPADASVPSSRDASEAGAPSESHLVKAAVSHLRQALL